MVCANHARPAQEADGGPLEHILQATLHYIGRAIIEDNKARNFSQKLTLAISDGMIHSKPEGGRCNCRSSQKSSGAARAIYSLPGQLRQAHSAEGLMLASSWFTSSIVRTGPVVLKLLGASAWKIS